MNILLGLLTVIMVLDCILLVFLILLQLPKKEAGAGMAFGAGATDALFGAGSGNVLTKITKYVAGIFFGLALLMAIITSNINHSAGSGLIKALTSAPITAPAPASNSLMSSPLLTNVPKSQSTATNSTGTQNLLTVPTGAATTNK